MDSLWRPLGVAAAVALLIEAPALAALGATWGVLVAAFAVLALLAMWPLAGAVLVLAVWWAGVNGRKRGGQPGPCGYFGVVRT